MAQKITGEELAGLLFHIHHHDTKKGDKIIYYEDDLLPILKFLGLPSPKWGKAYTIEQLKELRKGKVPDYGKDPFFIKKANSAKKTLKKVGLPKSLK